MGSLRKMFKTRLPALATLWSANGGPGGEDDDPDDAELQTVTAHSPSIIDPADPSHSRLNKHPDSTYELMRECPEIIEEVVERRYNTGTIVRPHLRHGLRRLSVQNVFEESGLDAGQVTEASTEDTAEVMSDATGKVKGDVTGELTGESTSDSGMSSGKGSDAGDTYAVPKSETYEVPRGTVGRSSAGQGADGSPELQSDDGDTSPEHRRDGEDSEAWSCDSVGEPSSDSDGVHGGAKEDGCYVECVRDPPDENVYLEPKTVEEIERDRQKLISGETVGSPGEPQGAAPETHPAYLSDPAGQSPHLPPEPGAPGGEPYSGRVSTMLHKARSLQNLQQCFIEIHAVEPTANSSGSSKPRPKTKHSKKQESRAVRNPQQPPSSINQSINDNFVLRPSKQFETYSRGLRSSLSLRPSLYSSAAPWDGDRQPWEAAPSLAEDALQDVSSRGSTLERGYERLPLRRHSAQLQPPLPSEPLYANSGELQQLLLQQLREQSESAEPTAESAKTAQSAEIGPDVVPIAPRGRRRRRARITAPQPSDQGLETHPEQPDTPSSPAEALLALKIKDSKFACVRVKPATPGRGTMRKSSSMSNLGPVLFTPPPPAPVLPSGLSRLSSAADTAAERPPEEAEEEPPLPPPPVASPSPLPVWFTLGAVWMAVCGWAGAAGRALGRATAPLTDWLGVKYMGLHRNHPWLPDLVNQPDLDYWIQRTKQVRKKNTKTDF